MKTVFEVKVESGCGAGFKDRVDVKGCCIRVRRGVARCCGVMKLLRLL